MSRYKTFSLYCCWPKPGLHSSGNRHLSFKNLNSSKPQQTFTQNTILLSISRFSLWGISDVISEVAGLFAVIPARVTVKSEQRCFCMRYNSDCDFDDNSTNNGSTVTDGRKQFGGLWSDPQPNQSTSRLNVTAGSLRKGSFQKCWMDDREKERKKVGRQSEQYSSG